MLQCCVCIIVDCTCRTAQFVDDRRRMMAATLARRNPGMNTGDVSGEGVIDAYL